MNAAHWQQQQQMSFQQQGGMQPQGFYQPTGGLPGNWGGMNPNQGMYCVVSGFQHSFWLIT